MNVGCELLRYELENRLKPILHVFGHIHGAYGAALIKNTLYVNAATCTERYIPSNKPIVVELNEVDGQIIATYLNE
jgi:Icc-related predicted phosphoesterase